MLKESLRKLWQDIYLFDKDIKCNNEFSYTMINAICIPEIFSTII